MPPRGRKKREEQEPLIDLGEVQEDGTVGEIPEGFDIDTDVQRVLAELEDPGGAKVMVRRRGDDGKYAIVDTVPAETFSVDMLVRTFGGGKYELRILDARHAYAKSITVVVEGKPKIPRVRGDDGDNDGPRRNPLDDFEREATQSMLVGLVREVLGAIRQPQQMGQVQGADALDTAIKMVQVMQTSMTPLLEGLVGRAGKGEGGDAWEAFDRGLELGQAMAGKGDDVTVSLGRELLGFFRDAKKSGAMPQQAPQNARIGPAQNPPTPGQEGGNAGNLPPWAQVFAPYVPQLIQMASTNRDQGIYVPVILDQLPGAAVDWLAVQLRDRPAEFRREFNAAFPPVTQFPGWFDGMFEVVADELLGLDDDDEGPAVADSSPEGGSTPAGPD